MYIVWKLDLQFLYLGLDTTTSWRCCKDWWLILWVRTVIISTVVVQQSCLGDTPSSCPWDFPRPARHGTGVPLRQDQGVPPPSPARHYGIGCPHSCKALWDRGATLVDRENWKHYLPAHYIWQDGNHKHWTVIKGNLSDSPECKLDYKDNKARVCQRCSDVRPRA